MQLTCSGLKGKLQAIILRFMQMNNVLVDAAHETKLSKLCLTAPRYNTVMKDRMTNRQRIMTAIHNIVAEPDANRLQINL